MKENIMLEKALKFGVRVIKLARFLDEQKHKVVANQILRSGMSVGANISESEYASSSADFINKLQIARKEANETKYWLRLLKEAEIIENKLFESLFSDLDEITKLLGASVLTAKKSK
ncbi:MAG: four helix bundle protein [Firmicutes bacterium]|nr:four helix bundle protein [Bacillota bacterium]